MRHALVTLRQVAMVLLLAVGVVGFGLTSPAQAHQGTISVIGKQCVDSDTMRATFRWAWSNVPGNAFGTQVERKTGTTSFEGSWTGSGGSALVTVDAASGATEWTVTLERSQFGGTNSSSGPWEYVYSPWKNGHSGARHHDSRVEDFDWSACADAEVKDAAASIGVTAPTCESAGRATYSATHATLRGSLAQTVGQHTAAFDADSGHLFGDGTRATSMPYAIEGKLTGQQCAGPKPEPEEITQDDAGCHLDGYGAGHLNRSGIREYVWDQQGDHWTLEPMPEVSWSEWTFTPYTDGEYYAECAPGQPERAVREVAGEEASCELGGVTGWTDVYTTEFVWDASSRTWVAGAETGPVRTGETFTAYGDDEYFAQCAPPPPPDEARDVAGVQASCHIGGQQAYTLTYSTEYLWNPGTREWEAGEETGPVQTEGEFISYAADQLHGCHESEGEPEVKGVQATVPTVVDAGLGSSGEPVTTDRNPLGLLVVGAAVGLIGFAGARRRELAGR